MSRPIGFLFFLAIFGLCWSQAWAQQNGELSRISQISQAETGSGEGVVRRIKKDLGKVTIRHGPLQGTLSMPPMSMVFRIENKQDLDKLKVGDKIRFTTTRKQGALYLLTFEKIQ